MRRGLRPPGRSVRSPTLRLLSRSPRARGRSWCCTKSGGIMAEHVPGYPGQIGGRNVWVVQHAGPASYVQGGETFSIVPLNGGGVIDDCEANGLSFNSAATGTYSIQVSYPIGQGVNGASGAPTVTLKWIVVGT